MIWTCTSISSKLNLLHSSEELFFFLFAFFCERLFGSQFRYLVSLCELCSCLLTSLRVQERHYAVGVPRMKAELELLENMYTIRWVRKAGNLVPMLTKTTPIKSWQEKNVRLRKLKEMHEFVYEIIPTTSTNSLKRLVQNPRPEFAFFIQDLVLPTEARVKAFNNQIRESHLRIAKLKSPDHDDEVLQHKLFFWFLFFFLYPWNCSLFLCSVGCRND